MKIWLPIAWLYGGIMALRNWLFDVGMLPQREYPIPVISVGNLAVGGTGKTPHTEYLLRLLTQQNRSCGVLSRGYGRKTTGYREGKNSSPAEIGDEPWQIQHRFPQARVCVCEKRTIGIEKMSADPSLEVVILDDAYQHRYVKPGLSILLTEYVRPYYTDYILPAGRLRESRKGARRADIIIVTKSPAQLPEEEQRKIIKALAPQPHQQIFFSTFVYGKLYPFSHNAQERTGTSEKEPAPANACEQDGERLKKSALLFCGIARPQGLIDFLRPKFSLFETIVFADHHNFSEKEIEKLAEKARDFDYVITTEKDAARLRSYPLPKTLHDRLWVQPVEVRFLNETHHLFNSIITNYVTAHSRNSQLD